MNLSDRNKVLRRTMSSHIREIIDLLYGVNIAVDVSGLNKAMSLLNDELNIPSSKDFPPTEDAWGYNCSDIKFTLTKVPDGIYPKISSMEVFLEVNLIADYIDCGVYSDPFKLLECNIIVKGYKGDNEYVMTYHLDKHLDIGNAPEYPHPCYHFHFGGKNMGIDKRNFGDLLLFDSPRIAYMPMEIFLGIDFILSNYFPEQWSQLRQNGRYTNIYRHYQNLFWRPMMHSLANHWTPFDQSQIVWDSNNILPQLIPN